MESSASLASPPQEGWEGQEQGQESPLVNNYRVMLAAKEQELEELRARVEQAEQQLKIQTKVNSEVKRLLVASVGEDIEARVDFLTQDKARLAADVMQYSNQVATDWEAKEALGVESDVWRSKYLASSVIVEELDKSRQEAVSRSESLEHAGRRLLGERSSLRQSLAASQQLLSGLTAAFDPLSQGGQAARQEDVLQAAERLHGTAAALSNRLVGATKKDDKSEVAGLHCGQEDTGAEGELRRLLGRPLGPGRVPQGASTVLAKEVRPHLLKLGDKAGAPHRHGEDGFKTCSHCQGSVQVV